MTIVEQELRQALAKTVTAMKEAMRVGCVDHLDCCEDAGEFWYSAIEEAEKLLK